MAYSYVRYTGNGSTTNYTFSFSTISTDHLKVRVNGALVTNWSFLNASTVQFAAAPASGAIIEIRRETPKESAIVNFTDGSVLLERDLDLLVTYNLYVAQETDDSLEDAIAVTSTGKYNADGKQITNLADPDDPTDAVNLDYLQKNYGSNMGTVTPVVTLRTYVYVATAGQTVFTGGDINGASLMLTEDFVVVTLNGLQLRAVTDYTLSGGNTITLVSQASAGDELQVQAFSNFNVANIPSSSVGYTPAGIGAVATTMQSKLRESVSVLDFMTPEQRSDVLSGNGTLDVLPAINAAIASVTRQGTFVYPATGIIELPRGAMFLNGTLTLSSGVHLVGHGAGQQGSNWATQFKFPADTAGIVVVKANTGPNQNGGDSSIIEGVYLLGGGGSDTTKHGVDMQARMKLRDVTVVGFAGNGINIVADVGARKNANCWSIDSVTALFNGLHGIYAQGGDANAGYAIGVDASNNNGWGIWDSSFLGNTYVGCHTDGNGRKSMVHYGGNRYYCLNASLAGSTTPGTNGAVWASLGAGGVHVPYYPDWVSGATYLVGGAYASTGVNARNMFIGCYSESGSQPPSNIVAPSMVLGGLHASGFTAAATSTRIIDSTFTLLKSQSTTSGGNVSIGTGSGGDTGAVMALGDPSSSGVYPYRLKYSTGRWELNWGNAADWLYLYNRDTTPANGFARDLSSGFGGIGFPGGYYGPSMKYRGGAAAAPTTGTYLQGDIVYNTSPTASGFVGWVCVAGGTPGTWKTFGAISA